MRYVCKKPQVNDEFFKMGRLTYVLYSVGIYKIKLKTEQINIHDFTRKLHCNFFQYILDFCFAPQNVTQPQNKLDTETKVSNDLDNNTDYNHLDSSSNAVPEVWDLNLYNPQGGPWLPLGAAWYPMQSY